MGKCKYDYTKVEELKAEGKYTTRQISDMTNVPQYAIIDYFCRKNKRILEPMKKYILDAGIRDRIRDRQHTMGYSNKYMSILLNVSISRYQNLIKKDGIKYILGKDILRISDVLKCSPDYLIGTSPDPDHYEDKTSISFYTESAERRKKIENIRLLLTTTSDYDLIDALYILLLFSPSLHNNTTQILKNLADIAKQNEVPHNLNFEPYIGGYNNGKSKT